MQISTRQINGTELSAAINAAISGGNFSGMLNAYTAASGYMGPTLVYATGGSQTVLTAITFQTSPMVQYSGASTGSAASQGWTQSQILYFVNALSGSITGGFVRTDSNQTIYGYKVFTGAVGVGTPTLPTHAATVLYVSGISGILQAALDNVTVANSVDTYSAQTISGTKTFTVSPLVPTPTAASGVVNKAYVDALPISGVVHLTGVETISGVKTFLESPLVPLATLPTQAVSLQQLNALGTTIGGITGFAGVASINGSTGAASGAVYLQGAGTVTISQCGAIFYVSGVTANLTQFYSAQVPLPSGVTGLSYTFPTGSGIGFNSTPTVNDSIVVTNGAGSFFGHYVYGLSSTGFNVAFQTGIPSTGFTYHFGAIPSTGASGFFGLQGQDGGRGATLNSRGVWQAGVTYSNLDWVYQPSVFASYACNQTHISTSFNAPDGTGSFYWAIMSSGTQGPTGYWVYRGEYNPGTLYSNTHSASLSGSTYGYTGGNPQSGISPFYLTSGWGLIAKAGDIGYFINSGTITGNFVNMSFFLEPVITGLDAAEAFVSRSFQYTGYALGCVTSGIQPDLGNFILTGRIYTRDFVTNTKTTLHTFTLNTGVYNLFSGNFGVPITGMNRLGVELLSTLSGITKLSVGLFGFGLN